MRMSKSVLFVSFLLLSASLAFAGIPKEFIDLPKADQLRRGVEKIEQKWGDENITSSHIRIEAVAVKLDNNDVDGELQTLTPLLMKALFEKLEDGKYTAKAIDINVKPFQPEAITFAAELVSDEGFCYTPSPENRKPVKKALEQALSKLALSPTTGKVAIAHTRAKSGDEWKNLSLILFFNSATKSAVYVYVRQGSM